jgi:hypothetical protein
MNKKYKFIMIGSILTVGIFSKYIFGYNNLAEEISELLLKVTTGKDVNFSHEVEEDVNKDLNRFIDETHNK